MLGSKKSGFSVSGNTTLVSQDTVIVGDVRFSGNLDIEGLVQGNIVAEPGKDALVRLVGKGRVEGDIRVPCVIINGEIIGDVYSSKQLELASKARIGIRAGGRTDPSGNAVVAKPWAMFCKEEMCCS